MKFRILDALGVERDGSVLRPRGRRERAALSLLILRADAVVPIGDLVAAVWDDPPHTAPQQIHIVLSRLRDLIGPEHERLLVTASPGYQLRLGPDGSDLAVFERLVRGARAAAGAGDPALAAARFRQALALWRGPPLAELSTAALHGHAVRLAELHLAVLEERIEADLAAATGDDLVAELTGLVAEHPYRERLRGQLMTALYRTGRRADALAVYRDGRRRLLADIGVEPGAVLRELERAVLTGSARLAGPGAGSAAGRPVPAVDGGAPAAGLPAAPELPGGRGRNDLPPDVPVLVGREAELEVLLGAGDPGGCAFVAVDGMGGVGKTALAVHAAHRLADRYPDAALFVSLHGHSSSRRPVTALHALGVLLRALGVDGSHLPARLDERAALWRATAAGRRMLVLLDDAIDARQVRPLIASSRGCLTIVTSRRRLSSVDWTRCLSLDVLGADRAGALFAERAGELRATQEQSAVREVVRLCGGLPLALCAAGARVRHRPTWTVRDLAERLGDEQRRLSELSVGERSIAGSLRLSYDHLSAAQQRALRLLAILPGDEFGAPACAAAAGIEVAEAEADLEELVDVHLVQSGRPGRYRLHDLVRQFARALSPAGSDPAGEPVGRLLDFHLAMAVATVDLLDAQRRRFEPVLRHRIGPRDALPATAQEAAAWLDLERANLVEAVRWAYEHGKLRLCWQLACALWPYFHFGKYTDDWFATHRYALRAAAELADPRAEAMIHEQLGVAYWMANRDAEAARHNRLALTLHRRAEDDRGQGAVLGMLGRIAARAGDDAEALRQFEASLALLRRVGDDVEEAHVLNSMAILRYRMGDADASSATFGAALLLFRAVGDERSEARVLANIGYLHLTAHRYAEALELLQRALRLRERLIDRRPSELLKNLAMALRGLGRLEEALRHQQEALAATLRLDDPRELAGALNDLAETLCSLERPDEARARYREALAAARRCDDEAQQARARDGLAALSRRSPETTRAAAPARRPPAASA